MGQNIYNYRLKPTQLNTEWRPSMWFWLKLFNLISMRVKDFTMHAKCESKRKMHELWLLIGNYVYKVYNIAYYVFLIFFKRLFPCLQVGY